MNLSDEVDLEQFVSRPEKLSGADIQVPFDLTTPLSVNSTTLTSPKM